jgi:hypothetical protein
MKKVEDIPENHPIKRIFRRFTERGMAQASVHDPDLLLYLTNLLVEFLWIENLSGMPEEEGKRPESPVDLLVWANDVDMPEKGSRYKHLGDYSLFMLGMFPEHIARSRRTVSPSWYKDTGRIGYQLAGELDNNVCRIHVFRKLADKFDGCVASLNWVRAYSTDPFYQWVFREFGIS